MKLTQDTLPNYFTIADITTSWHETPTNTFDFTKRHSEHLLVTVGDSWTWGSDISKNNKNDAERIAGLYGNVLSDRLSYDWLNLALCAQGNQWMADRVTELDRIVSQLHYKTITVIVVFTGAGRMFNTKQDQSFDYISYFKNNPNFDKFIENLNIWAVDQILKIDKHEHVNVYFSSNAVDPLGFNTKLLPWYQVLGLSDKVKCYTDMTAIDKLMQVPEFLQDSTVFKIWMMEQIDIATVRESIYNNATIFKNQHPLAPYHKIWADYLYKEIKWPK